MYFLVPRDVLRYGSRKLRTSSFCSQKWIGASAFVFLVFGALGYRNYAHDKMKNTVSLIKRGDGHFEPAGTQAYDHYSWARNKDVILKALEARNAFLGEKLLFKSTGMGDISTTGVDDQIKAYSQWASQPWVKTICEIGFAVGTSTITYLESNPHLRVISFDSMQLAGNASHVALKFIQERYGGHRIIIVQGLSASTLPEKRHVFAGLCDIISVDGMHDMTTLTDLRNFHPLANPNRNVILADDCVPIHAFESYRSKGHPKARYFKDVWYSWRLLIDEEKIINEFNPGYYIYGGEANPILEPGNWMKGWCEGEFKA